MYYYYYKEANEANWQKKTKERDYFHSEKSTYNSVGMVTHVPQRNETVSLSVTAVLSGYQVLSCHHCWHSPSVDNETTHYRQTATWPPIFLSHVTAPTHCSTTHPNSSGDSSVLEPWTRDSKVSGVSPGRSCGRLFFSRFIFSSPGLFQYLFHPIFLQ